MKKMMLAALAAALAAPLFGLTKEEQIAQWEKQLAEAKYGDLKGAIACNLWIERNPAPADYAAMKAMVAECYKSQNADKPQWIQGRCYWIACNRFNGKFAKEAYAEAKAAKNYGWTYAFSIFYWRRMGISFDEVMTNLDTMLANLNNSCMSHLGGNMIRLKKEMKDPAKETQIKAIFAKNADKIKAVTQKNPKFWAKCLTQIEDAGITL